MIKLLQSQRLKIPIVYLIESYADLKELPLGIPFIRGKMSNYNNYVKMMEWEVLWKSCKATGLPFNWEKILRSNGYSNVYKGKKEAGGSGCSKVTESDDNFDINEGSDWDIDLDEYDEIEAESCDAYDEYLDEISYKVDIDVLKELRLLPVWLDNIEAAVKENITNSIIYNPALYTKKLDLPLGGIEYSPANKNVIIIDISGSIPDGIAKTMLVLSKTLAEQFYADLVITGGKSGLYEYGNLDSLNTDIIFEEYERGNDQAYFKKLVEQPRKYKTALVFGDNDEPGYPWKTGDKRISDADGKKLCKWEIEETISFHTKEHTTLAGYSRWFSPKKITHIENWVKDLR